MINLNENEKWFIMKNQKLELKVSFSPILKTIYLNNIQSGKTSNTNLEFFEFEFLNKRYSSKNFTLTKIESSDDGYFELVGLLLTNEDIGLSLRLNFLSDNKNNLQIIYQLKDSQKDGLSHRIYFHSEFLEKFSFCNNDTVYYPRLQKQNAHSINYLRFMKETFQASDINLPLVVTDQDDNFGFSFAFPFLSDLIDEGSAQNRDVTFSRIASKEQLKNHKVKLAADNTFNDSAVFEIKALSNGWVEAFSNTREEFLSDYNLSEYKREDLSWFSSCLVHNFTYLYSKSGFDYNNGKIDVKKIIERGKKFGGFDTVTLWHEYPRLGVDKRSQWQFYNEIQGNIDEFKRAVDEFHHEGIKVFLPFIPWDNTLDGNRNQAENLAELINKTGADGVQLDTLDSLHEIYRKSLDKVSKGRVLTSQKHPSKKKPLETITTSWDEFFYSDFMPQVDILRFMMPFHISPALSRWDRFEEKNELIDYAVFSAEPIVIFEDVFGRTLNFSDAQAKRIKEYKFIYLKYKEIYQCKTPIPLYPTEQDFVYCNLFHDDSGKHFILSLYNESSEPLSGTLVNIKKLNKLNKVSVKTLISESKAEIKDNYLIATLESRTVSHFLLY